MAEVHVIPRGDLVEHEISEDCVCGPEQQSVDGGWVIVHHSLDGREGLEHCPATQPSREER